jgi:DeoR/GlpR family transcriptional regulator of sugar metabolism
MGRKDNMSPRTRSFSNEEVLAAIENARYPFVTATDLADVFDVQNRTILDRLNELQEAGEVKSRKVGARAVIWWIPETQ